MPTQQGIGSDDVQRLLPELGAASQQHQAKAVSGGQLGTFDLVVEDNELLAKHGVFGNEIGLAGAYLPRMQ
jgi:hypothetical protein